VPSPMTVTAAQGGSTANGLAVEVVVLAGAAAVQNGATASQSGVGGKFASLTTTVTGSVVYGALSYGSNTAPTPESSCTIRSDTGDGVNGEHYVTFRTTSPTGTPGLVTVGAPAPSGIGGGMAALEVLPNGFLGEDPSAPPVASTTSATSVTTMPFVPPGGALLVALVASDGGSGPTTMAVSGGGVTWTEVVAADASSQDYAGVWAAVAPPADGADPVITATQGGSSAAGMALRVRIVTGAAAVQSGATATQSGVAAHQAAITPNTTGSVVYAALSCGSATAFTPTAATTLFDNIADGVNTEHYGTGRSTATQVSGTPATIGASAPATGGGGTALLEVIPAAGQVLAEDAVNSPAVVSTTSAITVSTANFSAPPGSLLVAMVACDGSAGVETMTVSGGGLAWAEAVKSNASGQDYAGVWIAQVPSGDPGRLPQLPNYLIAELAAGMALRLEEDQPAAVPGTVTRAGSLAWPLRAVPARPCPRVVAGLVPGARSQPAALTQDQRPVIRPVRGRVATGLAVTAPPPALVPPGAVLRHPAHVLAWLRGPAGRAVASGARPAAVAAARVPGRRAAVPLRAAQARVTRGVVVAAATAPVVPGTALRRAWRLASGRPGAFRLGIVPPAVAPRITGSVLVQPRRLVPYRAGRAVRGIPAPAAAVPVIRGRVLRQAWPAPAPAPRCRVQRGHRPYAPVAGRVLRARWPQPARAPACRVTRGQLPFIAPAVPKRGAVLRHRWPWLPPPRRSRTAPALLTAPVPAQAATGTARQGVTAIPAAVAGQSPAASAQAGTTGLPAARAQAGQAATPAAQAGQMPLPHAQGGT